MTLDFNFSEMDRIELEGCAMALQEQLNSLAKEHLEFSKENLKLKLEILDLKEALAESEEEYIELEKENDEIWEEKCELEGTLENIKMQIEVDLEREDY